MNNRKIILDINRIGRREIRDRYKRYSRIIR